MGFGISDYSFEKWADFVVVFQKTGIYVTQGWRILINMKRHSFSFIKPKIY